MDESQLADTDDNVSRLIEQEEYFVALQNMTLLGDYKDSKDYLSNIDNFFIQQAFSYEASGLYGRALEIYKLCPESFPENYEKNTTNYRIATFGGQCSFGKGRGSDLCKSL